MESLEILGLDSSEEAVYRALLGARAMTATEIVRATRLARAKVTDSLATLAARGLVFKDTAKPERFSPTRPDIALEALIADRQRALQAVRAELPKMLNEFSLAHIGSGSDLIQIIDGAEACARVANQIVANANREVCTFFKLPMLTRQAGIKVESMDPVSGRRERVICDPAYIEHFQANELLGEWVRQGREVRVGEVPMKLLIGDRKALVTAEAGAATMLLVERGTLLDALVLLFEFVWSAAIPFPVIDEPGGSPDELSPSEAKLLFLLIRGDTDTSIARHFGINRRTLYRRISPLIKKAGASNRYDLVLQAIRKGWINP